MRDKNLQTPNSSFKRRNMRSAKPFVQEQSRRSSIIIRIVANGHFMRLRSLPAITVALFSLLWSNAQAQLRERGPIEWRTFEIPEFGTRVQFPASIFAPAGKSERGSGQRFERADGRAALSIYSRPNDTGEDPATYLKHNLRMDRSRLDYARITRSFFAISSERQGVILYSRCNFSRHARGAIHCFDLTYPQEEKRSWDAVVTRISLSLRPLEG
jgi:hypothetical protein